MPLNKRSQIKEFTMYNFHIVHPPKKERKFTFGFLWCSLTIMILCLLLSSLMASDSTETYIKWIEEVALAWIEKVATCPCTMLHKRTWCWQSENFYLHNIPNSCPPKSVDYNSLDYFVWGTVEWETNTSQCNNKVEKKKKVRISAAFTNLKRPSETLAGDWKVVWRPWLKPVAITFNKFNQSYFRISSCSFDN